MPKNIRIAGTIRENDSKELRKSRAKLLYHLFLEGFNIYNSNGDQDISLWNIQKKIEEADGFVFMPGATLEDLVKASSVFVGYQTGDKELDGKPTVILNSQGSWSPWFRLIHHLHKLGTVSQKPEALLREVEKPRQVPEALHKQMDTIETIKTHYDHEPPKDSIPGNTDKPKPDYNVCVFCSASTKNPEFLTLGYDLGQWLAKSDFGCVTGAGRTGIMGSVVRGAYEGGGWTGGSNIPHIIELEGLPDGLNTFWPTNDIYRRMEIMIKESDAFVVLPGGMGSVQETLVLLHLKEQGDPLMKDKKIILANVPTEREKNFWEPLIELIEIYGASQYCDVAENLDEIISLIES